MSEKEVLAIINSHENQNPCELDIIPTHLLKRLLPTLLPSLTHIVNRSLIGGEFSPQWKCAIVRPLLKGKKLDKTVLKNYRPVSNLSFISKLVEKCVLKQFNTHCENYNLIPGYQSAYRKGYSCETCVLKYVNDLLWAMENQHITATLFCDLSAAFDSVNHDLLLRIYDHEFGIVKKAKEWFESYLRPRSFKVCVGDGLYLRRYADLFQCPPGIRLRCKFLHSLLCINYRHHSHPYITAWVCRRSLYVSIIQCKQRTPITKSDSKFTINYDLISRPG